MRFLIDSMLPPSVCKFLDEFGHDATTPVKLGAHNLSDEVLVQLASADGRIIVTENASDFAGVTECPVLFVRKAWWATKSLAPNLALALHQWADANPEPGRWPHWMSSDFR